MSQTGNQVGDAEADLDIRRRRVVFRAGHRGLKELDVLIGSFANAKAANLNEKDLGDLEKLLEQPDPDVLTWLTAKVAVPVEFDTPLFRQLLKFHDHQGPIYK